MEQGQAQQNAVQRIQQANNILVTVSANPSVDQLAAAIGLTLLLNRLDKHATAVFSGQVPSTIEFLQPEKTLEHNTDSLRDFIISLDKNKADKLRYKVEDQFVRIFITPYKTSLGPKDLAFSEGDFNVELIIALGVRNKADLDAAITAHGRILHDATTLSVYAGQTPAKTADLGQINMVDPQASSLCEMLVAMSDSLGPNLLDNQMATAFLTGIVSETHRFSNSKTTPKVMAASAKLMSAGANQQLIVSKLEPPEPPHSAPPPAPPRQPKSPPPAPPQPVGTLSVSHHPAVADTPEVEVNSNEIRIDKEGNIISPQTKAIKALTDMAAPAGPPQPPLARQITAQATPLPPPPQPAPAPPTPAAPVQPAADPHQILDPAAHQPTINTPFTADTQPGWSNAAPNDPLAGGQKPGEKIIERPIQSAPAPPPVDNARSAVNQALASTPFDPAGRPLQAFNATPVAENLHPTTPPAPTTPFEPAPKPPAPPGPPPSMPPPITASGGAVVPSPPQQAPKA